MHVGAHAVARDGSIAMRNAMIQRIASFVLVVLLVACGGRSAHVEPGPSRPTTEAAPRVGPPDDAAVEVAGAFLPPLPTAVTSFGAATAGGHVYVLGGYAGEPHRYSREGQSRALLRLRVDGGGAWETVAQLDHGAQGLALVAHGERVCRIGGNVARNAAGEPEEMVSVPDIGCFDPSRGAFVGLPPMPVGRSSHGAAVIGDTVYVAGGWTLDGTRDAGAFARTILALDLAAPSPTWRAIEAPFRRRAVGVATAAGKLYVIGGIDAEADASRRVDVFDPATGTFMRGPDFPEDAFGAAAVGAGDAIYASARGGVVHRLRDGAAAWEPVAHLAFPRFFHQLVAGDEGELLALGGIGGMHTHGRTRHVERVSLAGGPQPLAMLTMRYPGEAKNRQGIVIHDDFLYLFGGNDSFGQHDFAPENFVTEGHRLHLPSLRWERVADYPAARQTMQSVVVGDEAIFVGGFGVEGGRGADAVSHGDAYVFDFEEGTFAPRGGLEGTRTQFGLVAHDGSLYVFGGLSYDPARGGDAAFDHVRPVLRASAADRDAPFEPTAIDLPGPRRAFGGARLGDRYYLVGGMRDSFQLVDDCLVFDFATEAFAPLACPRTPRLSPDLVALGGKLYLAAGSVMSEGGVASARSIEEYDPATDVWRTAVDALLFDTRHARALAYHDRLLIVSTNDAEGRIRIALVDP